MGINPFGVHTTGVIAPHVYAAYAPHHFIGNVLGRKKREAQVPVSLVTGFTHTPYFGYFGHHVGVAPVVSPFVAHPNGALVPQEPAEVVEARAEHLAAHVKREAQVPVSLVTGFAHTPYFG